MRNSLARTGRQEEPLIRKNPPGKDGLNEMEEDRGKERDQW